MGNREAIQPCKIYRTEAEVILLTAKSVKADGAKGAANQQFPKRSTSNTGGYAPVAHELKEIRYQSRTYAKLETLMNRVNEESIKEAHRRQEKNCYLTYEERIT